MKPTRALIRFVAVLLGAAVLLVSSNGRSFSRAAEKYDIIFAHARVIVGDVATYTEPFRYAEGFEYASVNGRLALDAGKTTSERPGRVLRHQ